MCETASECNLFDYVALLQLSENFSDDGVLNLNFLRTLLVQIVKTLKQLDDARVNNSKFPWSREANPVSAFGFDKETQCGIVSMHDSLSKVSELHAKPDEISTKSQIRAECQNIIATKNQAVTASPTTNCRSSQCNNSSKLSTEHLNHCDFQKHSYNATPFKSIETQAISSQTKSLEFCELTPETVKKIDSQLKLNDRIMNLVDSKIIKLESNICGITTVASEIVNEMEKIESKLMEDSMEISHVRNSIEQLRQEIMATKTGKKSDEKASKIDINISSTTLADEELFTSSNHNTSSFTSHVEGYQYPTNINHQQNVVSQQVNLSHSITSFHDDEVLTQTNPIRDINNRTSCKHSAHSTNSQKFPLLHQTQKGMYMKMTEFEENNYPNIELTSQIESLQNQLVAFKSKMNLLEASRFSREVYHKMQFNEMDIQQTMNSLENEQSKCQSEIEKIYKEIGCINSVFNSHKDDIVAVKSDLNMKLENTKSEIFNELKLIGTELKCNQQKEFEELLKTINFRMDELKRRFVSIENVMATKADHDVMLQKVSIEYFDATKRGLTSSMLELISQLSARENDWQRSLNEMNQIMESKLNKDEISPLKDYLNKKVDYIQDRLKSLNLLKRETEAAGTKYRLLKGVKCISCDNNAMMKVIDTSTIPWKGSLSKRIPQKHFIAKLNEQINIKTDVNRAHKLTMQQTKNEKRVKSSIELTMPSANKIEK